MSYVNDRDPSNCKAFDRQIMVKIDSKKIAKPNSRDINGNLTNCVPNEIISFFLLNIKKGKVFIFPYFCSSYIVINVKYKYKPMNSYDGNVNSSNSRFKHLFECDYVIIFSKTRTISRKYDR